jgi:NCS2 family nucleobase:cation symporter-2
VATAKPALTTAARPSRPAEARRRPIGIIYGRDDRPTNGTLAVLGFQHAAESASKVTLPVSALLTLGLSVDSLETMIVVTLLVSGLCCIMISNKRGWFGFSHLAPAAILSSFVAPSLLAARAGGLPLVAGMTLVTGLVVVLLSRVLHRFRFLFPPEVVGLVAFMVGASQASLAVSRFLGLSRADQNPDPRYLLVAAITLGVLASLTVWGKGKLRLFSSTLTVLGGYLVAQAFHFIDANQWGRVSAAPWVDLPRIHPPGLAFDSTLIVPFVVLGLSAAMKMAGDLTVCEKISDPDWKRADLRRSRPALLTFGLGTVISSLFGGFAVVSSSSNIGLAAATGATSRYVGYACGAILMSLAFFPKMVALIAIVPAPVAGAMFLLVVSYNLIAGMQIIMSRMMETRHTYIIGLSLLFGLAADAIPGAFAGLPGWLRPLFASGLTLATAMVVFLNAIFHIGASRRQKIELEAAPDSIEPLGHFIEEFGATWGARREVVVRAVSSLTEFFESVTLNELAEGPVEVSAFFDEYRLDFSLRYRGALLEIPQERPKITLDSGPEELMRMSGYMLRRLADSVRSQQSGSVNEIEIHFEH